MEENAKLKVKETNECSTDNSDNLKDVPIEPFEAFCDFCSKKVTTCVKREYSSFIFPYMIIILYFYGIFYGSIVMLLTFLVFQNVIHLCPVCSCQITYKSFYPIKQKGKYYSFTFGGFAIVLKKIYVHFIIIFIIIFGVYLNIFDNKKNSNNLIDDFARKEETLLKTFYNSSDTTLTWESLINECGAKIMIENAARAREIFNKKYVKKAVQWKGYFVNAYIHKPSQFGQAPSEHLVNINVKMVPSETHRTHDLLLSMGKEKFLKHFDLLKNLNTGSPIEFKAEFIAIGDEWRPHHLHIIWINQTEAFMQDKLNLTLLKEVNYDNQEIVKLKNEYDKNPINGK